MSMGQLVELLGDYAYDISYLNSTMPKIFPFLDVTKDDRLILRWKEFMRYLKFGTELQSEVGQNEMQLEEKSKTTFSEGCSTYNPYSETAPS